MSAFDPKRWCVHASYCRSIPTRCRRGQAIGREGNGLLRTCATLALGRWMAAAGRLQGETGIQAIAPINRSITDKYPPQLAELGPAAHHGGGKRRAGRTIKVNPKRSGAWGRGLFTSLS